MTTEQIPPLTVLTERLQTALDSLRGISGTKRQLQTLAYFTGARTTLEALAMHCDEHGEMLDFAGLLYDEACDTLSGLQGAGNAAIRASDDGPGTKG